MNKYRKFFYKCFNGTIFLFCLTLTIWQFKKCIEKFQKKPVATTVSIEDASKAMFPSITICSDTNSQIYNAKILDECNLK